MRKRVLMLVLLVSIFFVGCQEKEIPVQKLETATAKPMSPQEAKEAFLTDYIEKMSLEEKVGQLFFVAFRRDAKNQGVQSITPEATKFLQEYQPGGVILFGENIDTKDQTKTLLADYQKISKTPFFFGIDEEGGVVSRLHKSGKITTPVIPPALELGKGDRQGTFMAGQTIGKELSELGFHVDFAPVADILTNPENTVIGNRAFGSSPEQVGEMATAFYQGLQSEKIAGSGKHFPGHGDTSTDSHTQEAVLEWDKKRMTEVELVPFQKLIEENIEFIMVGHIKTPRVTTDDLPASLSKEWVTGILREEMGFSGIVITDAMDMGAITEYYGQDAPLLALEAGVDMVLLPQNPVESIERVKQAVKDQELPIEEVEGKVYRILSEKYDMGLIRSNNQ